jgi:nicotinamide mononucleotide transporter
MLEFLSVNKTAFKVLGYDLSYIELVGTVFYLWSVWLMMRRHILTWPVGIISVLLYMALFYQIRLYADAGEQVYYLIASAYGWWRWSQSEQENGKVLSLKYSSPQAMMLGLAATLVLSLAVGALLRHVHVWLPHWFPEQASFPYLDALTTIMSFTAMGLMALKRIESWIYWIVVDVIGIGLYYVKGVWFVALLYVILLLMAGNGLTSWLRATEGQSEAVAS